MILSKPYVRQSSSKAKGSQTKNGISTKGGADKQLVFWLHDKTEQKSVWRDQEVAYIN